MNNLLKFLSDYKVFFNEKKLFQSLEKFLTEEFEIHSLISFSVREKFDLINFSKCRYILGKENQIMLLGQKFISDVNQNVKYSDLVRKKIYRFKSNKSFIYCLNLGTKKNQCYFAVFSTNIEIDDLVLETLVNFSSSQLKTIEAINELQTQQALIHIDDVTGLFNQRKLYKDLLNLAESYKVDKSAFTVLFVDIDHFKKVNDNYGHLIGTKLLEKIAFNISSLLRDNDYTYRYGGDEFVVILTDTDLLNGKKVAERILKKISSDDYTFNFLNQIHTLKLTVSIGVAEFPTDALSAEDVLAIADRMMYEAKGNGRGLVFSTHDIFEMNQLKMVNQKK